MGAANAQVQNDTCSALGPANTIPGTGTPVGGVVGDITSSPVSGDANCSYDTDQATYFQFTPSTAGPWIVRTCGSPVDWDSIVSFHTQCPQLWPNTFQVANRCYDQGCGTGSNLTSGTVPANSLVIGTTYIVRVAGYGDPDFPSVGPFVLEIIDQGSATGSCCASNGSCTPGVTLASCVSPSVWTINGTCSPNPCPQPSANDLCANPIALTAGTPYDGTNVLATSTNDGVASTCQSSVKNGVWFSYTVPAGQSGSYKVSTCGGPAHDTILTVFAAGVTCSGIDNAANILVCNDDAGPACTGTRASLAADLVAGSTYLIRMQTWNSGTSGAYQMLVEAAATIACCDDNTGVCSLVLSPNACASGSTANGSTCSPTPCPAASACCFTSGLCTLVTQESCVNAGGTSQGTPFTCSPSNPCPQPPAPGNDSCASATDPLYVVPAAGGSVSGTASGATSDGDSICGDINARDVYHAFTPAANGWWEFSLCSSTAEWDSVISVHTGCPADLDNEIYCEDFGCDVDQAAIAGLFLDGDGATTYIIRIGTYDSDPIGDVYTLTVTPISAGACCLTAGGCTNTFEPDCTNGTFQGNGSVCTTANCPVSGRCCDGSLCSTGVQTACVSPAIWTQGATCSPNPCGVPVPANDPCTSAFNLNSALNNSPNTYSSPEINTIAATNDGPVPEALVDDVFGCTFLGTGGDVGDGIDNSIWYVFTPCSSGSLTITAPQPDTAGYDGVMVVYQAASCSLATAASAVGCADEEPMTISSLSVTAGLTYYIGIGDWGVSDGGGPTQVNFTFSPSAPCTPPGTCCRGTTCNTGVAQASCTSPAAGIGATYAVGGLGNACNALNNRAAPCCYADFNKTAGVTVQDIFDYLAAWFAGSPYARYAGDGTGGAPTAQSIFDFLAAWFLGPCPAYP